MTVVTPAMLTLCSEGQVVTYVYHPPLDGTVGSPLLTLLNDVGPLKTSKESEGKERERKGEQHVCIKNSR